VYPFNLHRPKTIREAVEALSSLDDPKLLGGGMTLLPAMKHRLAAPANLIDLSLVEGLSGVTLEGETIVVGAFTCHYDVAHAPIVLEKIPALARLAGGIGDPLVRHRGTIGGSVANNDPSADYPSACLALGATIVTSKREIHADDFFRGMFDTSLEKDEIIVRIRLPIPHRAGYLRFPNPVSRFSLVGVFIVKTGSDVRVTVTGAASNGVFRVPEFEAALEENFAPEALEGLRVKTDGLNTDIHADADYRAHLIGVLARRVLKEIV
jgi:carbon-monoxide dehydrogenase medium subunit